MEWKEIENTKGYYIVSNTGDVISVRTGKRIKQTLSNAGYYRVELNIDGRARKFSVHRLVAEAFLPNPDNLPVVNHKDENPKNNNVENLEWCTHKYNVNYGNCPKKISANNTYHYGKDNAKSKTVYQFDFDGNFIAEYGSTYEAGRILNLSASNIARACAGTRGAYAGYVWNYENVFIKPKAKYYNGNKTIIQYDESGRIVAKYNNSDEVEKAGFNRELVSLVCRGKGKTHKGYRFEYDEVKK